MGGLHTTLLTARMANFVGLAAGEETRVPSTAKTSPDGQTTTTKQARNAALVIVFLPDPIWADGRRWLDRSSHGVYSGWIV